MLDTCIPTVIHKSHNDKNRRKVLGKLTAGYMRSFKCLSDYEKNHTLSLNGVFYVTTFRRVMQGFSSLSPNYNPVNDCTSYRAILHYGKGKNEYSSITSATFSLRSDKWCDWSPPTCWQIWWQTRTVSLCTWACARIRISCWHSKQQWKQSDYATVTHLHQAFISNST